MDKPFIHLFSTPGGYYLYDVNKNRILKINKEIFELLSTWLANEDAKPDHQLINEMLENGFLSSKRISEVIHPSNSILSDFLKSKLSRITLQVTQQCNLRCSYCAYSGSYENRHHQNKKMSFETAKKGIDYVINRSKDASKLVIGFYGGEPLLELGMIKKCVEYAIEKGEGKQIVFSITTNGTLLNEETIEFLMNNDFTLLISLDGPKEVHDKNRKFAGSEKGSFNVIMQNYNIIKTKFPEYSKNVLFSIVLSPDNDISCVNEFFLSYDELRGTSKLASMVSDSYAVSKPVFPEDFLVKREYELFKSLLSNMGKMDKKYLSGLFSNYIDQIRESVRRQLQLPIDGLPDKAHHGGPCIPGKKLFLSVDGIFYPCEKVSESSEVMKIGNIDEGLDVEKCRNLMNIGKLTEEDCKNCWAFNFCTICALGADNLTEFSAEKKRAQCKNIRNNTEMIFRDYCILYELGYDFDMGENLIGLFG